MALLSLGRNQIYQMFRFSVVGVFTFVFYTLLLYFLVEHLGFLVLVASALSYVLALLVNYALHYFWTFGATASHFATSGRYLVMVALGFVANLLVMAFSQSVGWNYLIAQNVILMIIVAMNFVLGRFWVFKS